MNSSIESDVSMPWIEKYRPNHFDDIVLDPLNRVFFRNIIEKNHFSNLLFYGPPGTGKTTTIINLINEYQDRWSRRNKESVIHLNASDERGIDIIRTQIHQFVKSKHIFEVGTKFVILDEVDYMTKTAQQALKTLLQTCKLDVRFCLICNYISKIDESLQAEFICVRFNQLPNTEIHQFIQTIAEKEDIHLSNDKIDMIREMYQSDIRSMINFLQSTCISDDNDVSIQMLDINDWNKIHQLMIASKKTQILRVITELSVRYNIHLKHIMHQYLNYVIRKHPYLISSELLGVVEKIIHATDDFPVQHLLSYFVVHFSKCVSSG
jgi:replication factor C subunit 3/5